MFQAMSQDRLARQYQRQYQLQSYLTETGPLRLLDLQNPLMRTETRTLLDLQNLLMGASKWKSGRCWKEGQTRESGGL